MSQSQVTSENALPLLATASPGWRTSLSLAFILFVGSLILYSPSLSGAFVNYDDPAYVTGNAHVLQGLSWTNLEWAWTATVEANWHPLTWMSHMTDVQLFGTNPLGHHLVSIVFHAVNVVLLFLVLRRATGYGMRSAMVAALFAVHPLNVECVAWVAERKSLLSMFFLLLGLAAYGWYSSRRSAGRYAVVMGLFAMGLAAKPMVVTLPILLLLWDYWPLKTVDSDAATSWPKFWRLTAEKVPLLALSAASCWITLFAQRRGGALGAMELLPLAQRIQNAVNSYAAYVGKGIWPSGLAVFYPHPEGSLALWKVLAAGLLIAGLTFFTWRYRERHRYLFTGWLWYLAAMVPMIGLVQVGRQAMADRYAYLPFVGLFLIAVWGSVEFVAYLELSSFVRTAIACAVLVAYASVTFVQVTYWHNSYTLFGHALEVTSRNGIAENNFGNALMEAGRPDLALPHFAAAAEYVPRLSTAHYNLAVLQQQSRPDLAQREYELALKYSGDATEIVQSRSNLGFLFLNRNDLKAAQGEFTAALQINPDKPNTLLGRGMVEYQTGNLDAAIGDLSRAAQLAPMALADFWLGRALQDKGRTQEAIGAYEAALQLAPGMAEAQQRLSVLRAGR